MGAAYFIVLERKVDGLDTKTDGKSISRFSEELDALALQLGVRPLSEFISIDPEQAAEFLEDEGADADGIELPPLQQFPAKDGLATVQLLRTHIQANPQAIQNVDWVLNDLRECERILTAAEKAGIGWHFEVDF